VGAAMDEFLDFYRRDFADDGLPQDDAPVGNEDALPTKRSLRSFSAWRRIEVYHEQRELRRLLEDDLT
jgi:hypothetical protein